MSDAIPTPTDQAEQPWQFEDGEIVLIHYPHNANRPDLHTMGYVKRTAHHDRYGVYFLGRNYHGVAEGGDIPPGGSGWAYGPEQFRRPSAPDEKIDALRWQRQQERDVLVARLAEVEADLTALIHARKLLVDGPS